MKEEDMILIDGCSFEREAERRGLSPKDVFGRDDENNVDNEDRVHHPSHYCSGGIECKDAIKASMGSKEYKGYLKGNIQKYLWRYEKKNGIEDLFKAQQYLYWLIEEEQKEGDKNGK